MNYAHSISMQRQSSPTTSALELRDLAIIFSTQVKRIMNTALLKFVRGVAIIGRRQRRASYKVKFQLSGKWDRCVLGFDQYLLIIQIHPVKLSRTPCHTLTQSNGN